MKQLASGSPFWQIRREEGVYGGGGRPRTGVVGLDARVQIHGRVGGEVGHVAVMAPMAMPLRHTAFALMDSFQRQQPAKSAFSSTDRLAKVL
jgi:hypothetical protein